MPILVKDFTWKENANTVIITVPLKGVKANKADVFSTDQYLKVNFPPYLFELQLLAPIDEENSSCKVGDGAVVFTLVKQDSVIWNKLTNIDADDKEAWKDLRQQAVTKKHEKVTRDAEEKAKKKREEQQLAIKRQIELEAEEKERIEQIKEHERQKTTAELEQWQRGDVDSFTTPTSMQEQSKGSLFNDKEDTLPAPRNPGAIAVNFTPRVFSTAARESKEEEEREWLEKVAAAKKPKEGFGNNPEENNPIWLKDKGSSFFNSGDYLAAINAFGEAIRIEPSLPSLYLCRSACFLKIGDYPRCIEDCSKALERLTPPVAANAAQRVKGHVRRGTAYYELELYVDALQDYEQALKIEPNNESIKQDAEMIRKKIQGSIQPDDDTVD